MMMLIRNVIFRDVSFLDMLFYICFSANLSESYFTNRQDRYVIIRKCRALADFFHQLVTRVSSVSFTLKADDTLELAEGLNHHPYEGIFYYCL